MNPVETNGVAVIDGSKQSPGADASTAHPRLDLKTPYVPEKKNLGSRLGENRRILFLGGGIVLVLILVAFSGISRQPFAAQKSPLKNSSLQMVSHSETSTVTSSITPILEVGQSPQQEIQSGRVQPEQLERMAPKHTPRTPASSLAEIPPFENGGLWHPAPYREGAEANGSADIGTSSGKGTDRKDGEAMDKPSLVFASNAPAAALRPQSIAPDTSVGIGLSPGTRLRARLESAVSTAVHAPVIAIIEYSYERNGEIVVPAGSKMFGRIESADRTGYVELRFDSLLMPDGSSVAVTATATDLRLQPLRGKVEGRHTGKNILVRSVAGVGEIAATLVGRGSLNQPLSESDLLRERVTNNIGQTSDQSIAELAVNQRMIVSLPSDTEIYVVLQKETKPSMGLQQSEQVGSHANVEELRQLLQLQREMNQPSDGHVPD